MAESLVEHDAARSGHGNGEKYAELEALSKKLADKELELATLESRLSVFERRYASTVGVLLAKLDELEKEIARELLRLNPKEEYERGFRKAQRKAKRSRDSVDESIGQSEKKPFKPTDELKELFRRVAKTIHPDLASSENERAYRNSLMARANEAYKNGDSDALEQILKEWEQRDESSFIEETVSGERSLVEQKIAQARKRIGEIESLIGELKGSDLYQLMVKVEVAEAEGRDLLDDMVRDLQEQIQAARGLQESLKQER